MASSLSPRISRIARLPRRHSRSERALEAARVRVTAAETVLLTGRLAGDDLARAEAEAVEAYDAYQALRRS